MDNKILNIRTIMNNFLFISLFILIRSSLFAQNDINILIPDTSFRAYCLQKFDKNNDGWLSQEERNSVQEIDIEDIRTILNVKGIELFTNLRELYCSNVRLINLDVSKNTALTILDCSKNRLTSIDLTHNTNLRELYCNEVGLMNLDVSKNTALTTLDCYRNRLTILDISNNTNIDTLDCSENNLTSLDLTYNTKLLYLDCSGWRDGKINGLNFPRDNKIEYIDCSRNQIERFDLRQCVSLKNLDCSYNLINFLDLHQVKNLSSLLCSSCQLDNLDVSNNTELEELDCSENKLGKLELKNNSKLTKFSCSKNKLGELDLSNQKLLTGFNCSENKLKELDLSNQKLLTGFDCSENKLKELDLSNQKLLKNLTCRKNQLTKLILPQTSNLSHIDCSSNQIDSLDISKNKSLRGFLCSNNQLTILDFTNNLDIDYLDYSNNPNLTKVTLNHKQKNEKKISDFISSDFEKLNVSKLYYLIPFEKNGKWGMIDSRTKKVVIEPRYTYLYPFSPNSSGSIYLDTIFYESLYFKLIIDNRKIKVETTTRKSLVTSSVVPVALLPMVISSENGYKGFSVYNGELKSYSTLYSFSQFPKNNVFTFIYKGKNYAIVTNRNGIKAIIDTLGNTVPGFGFDYNRIEINTYSAKNKWFFVEDLKGNYYFKSFNGKTKLFGQIPNDKRYYNLNLGYGIFSKNDTTAVLDYVDMKWIFPPQSKIKFENITFPSQTEIDKNDIRNRSKVKMYILVQEGKNKYYIDFKGVKYVPKE